MTRAGARLRYSPQRATTGDVMSRRTGPHRLALSATALLALCGCYRSFLREVPVDAAPGSDAAACVAPAPTCIAPGPDACASPVIVAPRCDLETRTYACPAGSRMHVRETPATDCLPFSDPALGLSSVGSSLVRFPTPDGRCLWVAEAVTAADGRELSNVAFEPPLDLPFGRCPTTATPLGGSLRSVVMLEGDDGLHLVQLAGGFVRGGETSVVYRLFVYDASGGFGVRELGTGLANWDADRETVVVPAESGLLWPPEIDLGDAVFVEGDTTFLWGCPPPIADLVERCLVARVDGGAASYWVAGGWTPMWSGERTGFDAGPWLSSVTRLDVGYVAITTIGFGSHLRAARATSLTGDWSAATNVAPCRLPLGDDAAYCAGPVVHDELRDPLRPRELPVTYGIGTTAVDGAARRAARPRDYWARFDWVSVR